MSMSPLESSFTWLDFAEDDRRRMMEVVSLFKLRETRDELGLGSIRNAFAEMLFPGTGTMQTRARYFLIVPWIYLRMEKNYVTSAKIGERMLQEESNVISILKQTETDGVIGSVSGPRLNRFPSNIYWYGFARWGIFKHNIGQWQYHRSLDRIYKFRNTRHSSDDGEPLDWELGVNWDPALPDSPDGFPESLSLSLTEEESNYLQEKVYLNCGRSMLPLLIDAGVPLGDIPFAWFHPDVASFPDELQSRLAHARNFSELMYGAALLYNYLLAEKDKRLEVEIKHEADLVNWHEMVSGREHEFHAWALKDFWSLILGNERIPIQTRQFVNRWFKILLEGKKIPRIEKDKKACQLVRSREMLLKGGRSRFKSKSHRELWGGASGNFQMDYRWWVTKRIVDDIIAGKKVV